ncbi:MAG TPA: hypothetical protein VMB81_31300 [Candidatus Sulfotelmatobacter sp.]|nr:hypothetical protein [Candidatus Sulfotelmatobacter sp.]
MLRILTLACVLAAAGCTTYPVQLAQDGTPVICPPANDGGSPTCYPVHSAPENYKPSKNR